MSTLTNLPSSQVKDTLVWFLPDQVYNYERNLKDRNSPSTLLYLPPKEVFDIIITQHLAESSEDDDDKHNEESQANVLDRLSGLSKLRKQAEKRKHWMSLYLVVSAVPHSLYGHHPSPMDMTDAINMLMKNWNLTKEDSELIVHGTIDLIEYMKPVSAEEGNNLLDNKESIKTKLTEEPHWKNHLDVRIVYDLTPLTPQGLLSPHLKSMLSKYTIFIIKNI